MIIVSYFKDVVYELVVIDIGEGIFKFFDVGDVVVLELLVVDGYFYGIVEYLNCFYVLVEIDLVLGCFMLVVMVGEMFIYWDYVLIFEWMEFEILKGERFYGIYYLLMNLDCVVFSDDRLFLIVMVYGGFIGYKLVIFQFDIQFWMICGFVVFNVNYRGSIGFGWVY